MSVAGKRRGMGMVYATVVVLSADETQGDTVKLIVDTGSTLTWVHEEVLRSLGIEPRELRKFRTIEGLPVNRWVGDATIECEGLRGAVGVVFASPTDGQVLGVTALERLGLAVDPTTGELRKEDAYLALPVI